MVMDDLLLHIFCLFDQTIKDLHLGSTDLRRRGPQPTVSDAEVLTMEVVGEMLGLDRDTALFQHFRTYHLREFPALARIDRTTFVRQAANLWHLKERLHRHLAGALLDQRAWKMPPGTPLTPLWVIDSFPLPACRFARRPSCQRFKGLAACGFDHTANAVYYGFRVHLRCADCGVIGQVEVAPANIHDSDLVEELLPANGVGLGDRNYWDPSQTRDLAAQGKTLIAPFRRKSTDPWPKRSAVISKLRQVIEPVIGQLAVRFNAKCTWARDRWHLCSRLYRKILAHTTALILNDRLGNPLLQLELLFNGK